MTRQPGVDPRPEASRIVDAGGEEHDADGDHGHALQRAQRTGIEPEPVLEPQRPRHQRGAGDGAQQVGGPPRRQDDERERRDADRHHQDAPRRQGERRRVADELHEGFLREQDQRDREAGPRPRHFGITHHRCDFSNAWSRSQSISSSVSSPTDSRIISGVTPAARCSSSDSCRCVVDAG